MHPLKTLNSLVFMIWLLNMATNLSAQSVGIGTSTPNASARLEVNSTNQGILIPALTSAQRSDIASPATGLLIFQTDGTPGFYYYNGISWINLTTGYTPNSQGIAVSSNYGATTTLAGSGSAGAADGAGAAASFYLPSGVAVDGAGNVYVADRLSNKIRKITPFGTVTTLAGNGSQGSADGTGTAASFKNPIDVAVDATGVIYVADQGNHRIRKITPDGVVTTFAGSSLGAQDGTGTAASFASPSGVAVDVAGNVYVADYYNNKIRKISPGGIVTTLAGSGSQGSADATGTAASFRAPFGVAVDVAGNVYVADQSNHKIRKISPGGTVTTLAGSGSQGSVDATGTAASFYFPFGVAVDVAGNVYVADYSNNKIRKITPGGIVVTFAGSGSPGAADGIGTAASFNNPCGMAVDAGGNVYVGDLGNNKIRKIIAQ